MHHNDWSLCTLEPILCNEKLPQWEVPVPQLEISPYSLQLEIYVQQQRVSAVKNKLILKKDNWAEQTWGFHERKMPQVLRK